MTESHFLKKWRKTENAVPDLKECDIYAPLFPRPKLEDKSTVAV